MSKKQDIQREYAWLLARVLSAIEALREYNYYVPTDKHGGLQILVPNPEYIKNTMRKEYLRRNSEVK